VVNLAIKKKPVVIILDVELPGKVRGWQAVHKLNSAPEFDLPPIITCCWSTRQEAHTLVSGAVGHLQKPDIYYADFVAALKDAGVIGEGSSPLHDQTDTLPG
jgi:CheY-like chemotaxis protein